MDADDDGVTKAPAEVAGVGVRKRRILGPLAEKVLRLFVAPNLIKAGQFILLCILGASQFNLKPHQLVESLIVDKINPAFYPWSAITANHAGGRHWFWNANSQIVNAPRSLQPKGTAVLEGLSG